jgi:hypothetical protein
MFTAILLSPSLRIEHLLYLLDALATSVVICLVLFMVRALWQRRDEEYTLSWVKYDVDDEEMALLESEDGESEGDGEGYMGYGSGSIRMREEGVGYGTQKMGGRKEEKVGGDREGKEDEERRERMVVAWEAWSGVM